MIFPISDNNTNPYLKDPDVQLMLEFKDGNKGVRWRNSSYLSARSNSVRIGICIQEVKVTQNNAGSPKGMSSVKSGMIIY